jgi:tight adherence protein C
MNSDLLVPLLIFVSTTAAIIAMMSVLAPQRDRVAERIQLLSGTETPRTDTGSIGRWVRDLLVRVLSLFPSNQSRQARLRTRLIHAGCESEQAIYIYFAARSALVLMFLGAGGVLLALQILPVEQGLIVLAATFAIALLAPGFWLDSRKAKRQNELRQGLPDFFDMLVLCIEGGMSLLAAWRRVADELRLAYPPLWKELKLVEQEAEIGRPTGEALSRFSDRTDLDEVQSLASVVGQAERLGTELARPLRILSDTLRLQRVQKAEEAAHKTATKIMFPTLLLIFPGVFAIILGPMIIQVMNIFSGGQP